MFVIRYRRVILKIEPSIGVRLFFFLKTKDEQLNAVYIIYDHWRDKCPRKSRTSLPYAYICRDSNTRTVFSTVSNTSTENILPVCYIRATWLELYLCAYH